MEIDDEGYECVEEKDIAAEPPGKLVIPISRAGMIAGTIASSVGYTATNSIMAATSVSAGAVINGVGYLVEKTAGVIAGPIAEVAVHGARTLFAASTSASISGNAQPAALLVSAVAGTGACLSVTAVEMAAATVKKIAVNTASATGYIVGKIRGYTDGASGASAASAATAEVVHDS